MKYRMDFEVKYGWTKSANKILHHAANLAYNTPAMIFLRHSQREEPEKGVDLRTISPSSDFFVQLNKVVLTEEGKLAAKDFGQALPLNRKYRIFHSAIPRCAQTAHYIFEGIHQNTMNVEMKGELGELLHIDIDEEKEKEYRFRDGIHYLRNWLSGHYPPNEMPPLINYAKKVPQKLNELAQSATSTTMDIFITHDFHILVLLFYWAALFQFDEWIDYLDGFILQLSDNKMYFYYKSGKKEVYLPYWWTP